jgi:nucleotide-binding universal stress UspA family protein
MAPPPIGCAVVRRQADPREGKGGRSCEQSSVASTGRRGRAQHSASRQSWRERSASELSRSMSRTASAMITHRTPHLAILRVRGNAERLLANVLYDEQLVGLVDWRAEVGNVAERLAAVAADERALLILLGARSNGKARTFLRSRLAGEIVRKSSVPVMVVPPQGELEVAPPRIVEPRPMASRMRLDAESQPFPAAAGTALSAKSR